MTRPTPATPPWAEVRLTPYTPEKQMDTSEINRATYAAFAEAWDLI